MPVRTSPRKKVTPSVAKVEEKVTEKTNGAAKKAKAKVEAVIKTKAKAPATSKKRKAAKDEEEEHECDSHGEEEAEEVKKPAPKKRKTKIKEEDMAPLVERTTVSSLKKAMYIGAHVSAAGGIIENPSIP